MSIAEKNTSTPTTAITSPSRSPPMLHPSMLSSSSSPNMEQHKETGIGTKYQTIAEFYKAFIDNKWDFDQMSQQELEGQVIIHTDFTAITTSATKEINALDAVTLSKREDLYLGFSVFFKLVKKIHMNLSMIADDQLSVIVDDLGTDLSAKKSSIY